MIGYAYYKLNVSKAVCVRKNETYSALEAKVGNYQIRLNELMRKTNLRVHLWTYKHNINEKKVLKQM